MLLLGTSAASPAQQRWLPRQAPHERDDRAAELLVKGEVTEIHAPRLFTVRERQGREREYLVLVSQPVSAALTGASVQLLGSLRPLRGTDFRGVASEETERLRQAFAGREALIARSLIAITPRQTEAGTADVEVDELDTHGPQPGAARPFPLRLRAATLVDHIDEIAGQRVHVLSARVVGVLEPHAFLIEPALPYEMMFGSRNRALVLIDGGGRLRIPAESLVSAHVIVQGVARTLMGLQVSAEAPWPSRLSRELASRLEVGAAVLATSVQTAEGTELTDPDTAAGR